MFIYKATVLAVIDGDTLDLAIDLGFDLTRKIRIRLNGINTPELNSKDPTEVTKAKEAKTFVQNLLPMGKVIYIQTFKDKTEKYGRYLCEVYFDEGLTGKSLNQQLIDQNLAEVYII